MTIYLKLDIFSRTHRKVLPMKKNLSSTDLTYLISFITNSIEKAIK